MISALITGSIDGPPRVFAPVPTGETSWDCEAVGPPVNPGDIVRVIGLGTAD